MLTIRWRVNANGTEWFWGGKWWPANHPIISKLLCQEIQRVTKLYPQQKGRRIQ